MTIQKCVDGVYIDLTPEEIAQREVAATEAAEANEALQAKIAQEATNKGTGNQKLLDLGLTQAEVDALTGR